MPFAKQFDSYYVKIFKPALTQEGYTVKRADDIFGPRPIMDDVRKSIKEADLILCEVTGRNPNVYYELGLAHAIGKSVILVSQFGEDIPFDVHHIRVIIYDTTLPDWSRQLAKKIKLAIQDIETNKQPWPLPLAIEAPDRLTLDKDLTILHGRRATVNILEEIIDRGQQDDLIFGSCNTCSDYPKEFYLSLPRAVERGANILFVSRNSFDNQGFIEKILAVKKLAPERVRLLSSDIEYLRMFGIENKEVVIALTLAESFVGLHINDGRAARYFKLAFNEILKTANEVSLKGK